MNRKSELEAFADYIESRVTQTEQDESVYPDGGAACICTNGAVLVASRFDGEVFGFWPTPYVKCEDTKYGHDFAIVDHRYIVDSWLKHTAGHPRSVFDLEAPEDQEQIAFFYGDRSNWEKIKYEKVEID